MKSNFRIGKVPVVTPFHKVNGRWYICVNNRSYLHSDLTIQDSTLSGDGKYRGWYATRERARNAVRSYKEKNSA